MQIVFWMTTVLMTGYIALILFYRKCWKAIPDFKEVVFNSQRNLFISVIIPARNEEKNIITLLNSLKE